MAQLLKQSTAYTFRIGPFVDSTDAVTPETGLSIAQADIQISKAGGAFAQTSASSPTTTHDVDGWYQCPLTTTDTGTLGHLTVQIVMAGALPVWKDFSVTPANVYDSLIAGSDTLEVDALAISGDTTAADNAEAFFDGTGYAGTNNVIPTVTTLTGHTAQTGDSFARLGAPAGASVSADVAAVQTTADAIETDTQDLQTQVGTAGAGLSNIGTIATVTNVTNLHASAATAAALATTDAVVDNLNLGIIYGAAATGTLSTTQATSDLTGYADDQLIGRVIVFTSGACEGEATDITDYANASGLLTFTALTTAPGNGDTFKVV